ncbi:unnamed protein product [Blepharisma stoltei]|uniref:Cyclic nucleotide-binding domain-containing protein n=1 Tax=Blepharisma stoltei TaxID=1481888 RepID=A0AAU9JJR1_9CILI|nr:unnamed protein product [Blepharisma stoltei]
MNELKKRINKRRYSDTSLIDYWITYQKNHEVTKKEESSGNGNWFPIRQNTRRGSNLILNYLGSLKKQPSMVLNPESTLKIIFDSFHGLLIIMQLITIPFLMYFEDPEFTSWRKTNEILNFLFYFEIVLQFNTAYYEKGHLVCTRKDIAIKYLKTWFAYDMVACFPFDYILAGKLAANDDSTSLDALNTSRLFTYTKIIQLGRYFKLQGILNHAATCTMDPKISEFFKFFRLVLVATLVNHYTACAWYYLSWLDSFHYPQTWITKWIDVRGPKDTLGYYFEALYFAATTLFTIGYGDYVPCTISEKEFCIVIMSTGVLIFSYIESRISQNVIDRYEEKAKFMEYLVNLNIFMRKQKLPSLLKFKVRTYMDYMKSLTTNSELKELEVLKMLSPPLREEILGVTRGKELHLCPIFKQLYGTKLINEISKLLQLKNFAPEDVLFKEGENETVIYFITAGIVEVYHEKTRTVFKELAEGKYFGEIGFFTRQVRTASIRCVSFCDMISLSRDQLDILVKRKPDAFQKTLQLQTLCQSHDNSKYAPLGVYCYLCNLLGHTAITCEKIFEKINKNRMKEKWVKKRMTSKIFKLADIKHHINLKRKKRKSRKFCSPLNSSGSIRTPEELWGGNETMLWHVKTHLESSTIGKQVQRETDKLIRTEMTPRRQTYLNVLGDNESDESDDDTSSRYLGDQSLSPRSDAGYLAASHKRERFLSFPEAYLSTFKSNDIYIN